jgi:hypothetical protein
MTRSSDGRRGRNLFRQRDVVRAMRSAQAGGLAIGGVEVVTVDGTTIRVLGKNGEEAEHTDGRNDLDNWIANRPKDASPT